MFVAAGLAIAAAAGPGELVPDPLDRRVHLAVTLAVARAAVEAGVARLTPDEEMLVASFGDPGQPNAPGTFTLTGPLATRSSATARGR